jgi:SAM-dependent methyltransferase
LKERPEPPANLRAISRRTLAHYDRTADAFWEATRDHDVAQNVAALLRHMDGPGPFAILDLGCGPGRDLVTFRDLGHEAIGLDGSARFVAMARAHSGCEVLHQDILALDLPPGRFDGVFANASLFHVPTAELPRVLGELRATLRPSGILFASNPRGNGGEGWQDGRFGVWHDIDGWRGHLGEAGFVELEHYYRPAGRPRTEQPWLVTVWRRTG